jgi:branched-chain amino acid transport system substrate-binding protein
LNPKYYTSAGTGFAAAEFPTEKGAGKNADFTFSVSQWLPAAKWAGSKGFDAEYFKRFKTHPAYHAIQAYAALRVAAQAINDAKSVEPAKIRDAIKNINMTSTPFGPIKFDNGQNLHPVLITQVQSGQYRVVFPGDAAEAKPVIPAPSWSKR